MTQSQQAMALAIAQQVRTLGGSTYYVGGCVRDALMGVESKDVDIEVHGITPDRLAGILDGLGQRMTIGESFGIFALKGYDLDIAMPRRETVRGTGHRDFDVFVDPFLGTEGAGRRRDFTINALMRDVLTGELLDHFGGREDLRRGILRHVHDASFPEDPLRVLRAAQFSARFGFSVAPETIALCRTMELRALPRERIEGELKKALLKAEKPSLFFHTLRQMDQLDAWFPELKALIGLEQPSQYHAEGDVWNHTLLVLDEAAKLRHRAENPLGFLLAALTHDFGKAVTTEQSGGALHAYGHETLGIPLVETFLRRIISETRLVDYVKNLVALHMKPNTMAHANSAPKATNRMFYQALDPEALICLALADDRGRITLAPRESTEPFLRQRLALYRQLLEKPPVMGRDLMDAGLAPGPDFSEILAHARKLWLAGVEKESALKQTLAYARKLRK